MEPYLNLSRNSGVCAYELGTDFIRVEFINHSIYRYTQDGVGLENLNKMKELARQGHGLSTFISQHIKKNYAEKEL
ncbi:MAG: hypothetical protein EPN84_00610 [Legionella sp.]|nr:MAG: hypothetical protein EPN84_00610 [Legionella sp.]